MFLCFGAVVLECQLELGPDGGGYLGLLLLVQSYTLLICSTRSLANGTAVGLMGWVWGVALAVVIWPHSVAAVGLLIPYLLWSPVGTLVTWQMQRINR